MKICYIIGAGELPLLYISEKTENLIIAADGGMNALSNITPDIIVGDFDSLGFVPTGTNVIRLPVEKDITDMHKAVDIGFENGCSTFVIYGGTGGRPDHTFANYAMLSYISQKGGRGYLIGERFVITAITSGKILLPQKEKGTVSVLAFCDEAKGVDIRGLKYTLSNYNLTAEYPLGVSNSFIGESAEVLVNKGTLLIFWEENNLPKFLDNI